MKKTLLEQTNFNGLKELVKILRKDHALFLVFGEEAKSYLEITSTESETRFRVWWNEQGANGKGAWEVTLPDNPDSGTSETSRS